ncbi:MAG: RNA polymerase sigma factor [Ktedonobacteraceae bacterium]
MMQSITGLSAIIQDGKNLSDKGRRGKTLEKPAREGLDLDQEILNTSQSLEQDMQYKVQQAELVARCILGDEQAFAQIVECYGDVLFRTAFLLVQDEESAKDVVQDALLLAWKNMQQLREPGYLRAWLIRIVVNQATTLKRQWARKSALLRRQLLQRQIDNVIQVADIQRGYIEDALDTWQAIEHLPLNQRTVLVLFYYHRMTMPEIAAMLQVSENTLRKRLQAALEKVRKALNIDLSTTRGKDSMLGKFPASIGYSGGQRDE